MKEIRKALALFLALALLLGVGCSPASQSGGGAKSLLDPANPVTVTLWHYYVGENQQALESAVSEFNQTLGIQRGVIVEAVAKGSISELEEHVTASAKGVINAEAMPQLFSSYPDKAMEIDSYGMVTDLSEYFTQEEKSHYVADFLSDGIFDGDRLLVLPIAKSTELMYVNATGWNEFAAARGYAPESLSTWESLYDTAKAYYRWTDDKTPDVPWDGRALMGFDSVANYIIAGGRQLGIDVIDAQGGEGGRAVLDKTALRRIFDFYYQGMCLGYLGAEGKFRSDDIKAGSLIAYVGSSSSAAYFPTWLERENTRSPIDFLSLPYPVFEGGGSYAIQQGAGMCVAKSTPGQQEGAALFLKWFTSVEQNIRFAMTTGYLPVSLAAYEAPEFQEALETLRLGDAAQQNVAEVYEIALGQITQSNTYAAKPFQGSYNVRAILQSSLLDITAEGMDKAKVLKAEGLSEEEILRSLEVEAAFAKWLGAVQSGLEAADLAWTD